MPSPNDPKRSHSTASETLFTFLTRAFALLSIASLALALSVWYVALKWPTLFYIALLASFYFALFAALVEYFKRQRKDRWLDQVRSKAERQQRKIRKLRFGLRVTWAFSTAFALAGIALFVFTSKQYRHYSPFDSYFLFFLSAQYALLAWQAKWQLRIELIEDPLQREAVKATSEAAQRKWVYWIALVALPAAPALWLLTWVGVMSFPLPILDVAGAFLWLMVGMVGALLIDLGYKEKTEPPPPDCSSCDHEYDIEQEPIRCIKCGHDLCAQLRTWTNSPRPKRMFQLAAAYFLLAAIGVFASISPAMQTVLMAKRPARALIANLGGRFGSLNAQDLWTELITRMPLSPADRQRLVERVIAITVTNNPPSSVFLIGIDEWTADALPKTATYEQSIDDLLTYLDNTLPPPSENISALITAAKLVYMIDLADLPASQRNRAVRLAFSMAADKPISIAGFAKINRWLDRAFMMRSLSKKDNERVINSATSGDNQTLSALGMVRASTPEQNHWLASLMFEALKGPGDWEHSRVAGQLMQMYLLGELAADQSEQVVSYIRTMNNIWRLHDLVAMVPDEHRRLSNMYLAALENTQANFLYFTIEPIFIDYVKGRLSLAQSDRLFAILPSVMERGGSSTTPHLLEPEFYDSLREEDRVRLADVALRAVWKPSSPSPSIMPPSVRRWLDDRAAAGLLTDTQQAFYKQQQTKLDNNQS